MANPNKTARGSAATKAASDAVKRRQAEEDFVRDMGKFQRGEITADEFRAKWGPSA